MGSLLLFLSIVLCTWYISTNIEVVIENQKTLARGIDEIKRLCRNGDAQPNEVITTFTATKENYGG